MSDEGALAPYARIVEDIRAQITSGRLRAGDRVPSTRALVRDWGVAMATATKALSTLRDQGWVRTVPGSGTVVDERAQARHALDVERAGNRPGASALSRDRLVRAAIALADTEGRGALSMRRLAAELGVGPMSLYRHVPDKEELLRLMADAALSHEKLPERGPAGWRARLELCARLQWRAYQRHPWLATVALNSLVHPPVMAAGLHLLDWALGAVSGLGLDHRTMMHLVITLNGYVGGLAVTSALEFEAELDTGITGAQRYAADHATLAGLIGSGRFPVLARVASDLPKSVHLTELFEFGLQRQLDGIAALIESKNSTTHDSP